MKRTFSGYILDDTPQEKEMRIKEKILKQHTYQFTLLSTGYWQTYYRNPVTGKRMCIKRKTREEVEDVLIELVKGGDVKNQTFGEICLNGWMPYKAGITDSDNTMKRHRQVYNKYLSNSELVKKKINDIDRMFLNQFCNDLVKKHNLMSKAYTGIKTIIAGTFEYCISKDYLVKNPMSNVKITVKFRQPNKKDKEKQVFNTEERKKILKYLVTKYLETNDDSFVAIFLDFYLGLRISELSALKWADWKFNAMHIERSEVRNQITNETYIVNHTKTNMVRDVTVPPIAIKILQEFRKSKGNPNEDEYLFQRDGKRLRSRQLERVLEKYSQITGAPMKSSHKVRKTYASNLNAAGAPLDLIREELGHTMVSTTMDYIFDPLTAEESYGIIASALPAGIEDLKMVKLLSDANLTQTPESIYEMAQNKAFEMDELG